MFIRKMLFLLIKVITQAHILISRLQIHLTNLFTINQIIFILLSFFHTHIHKPTHTHTCTLSLWKRIVVSFIANISFACAYINNNSNNTDLYIVHFSTVKSVHFTQIKLDIATGRNIWQKENAAHKHNKNTTWKENSTVL